MQDIPWYIQVFLVGPPLFVAIILHEIAHGYVADKLGDPTARSLGRITLNPLKHIDPILSIALPAMLILAGSPIIFGGAKPVPINPYNFRRPRRDMVYVAIAGPLTNFALLALSIGVWLLFFSVFRLDLYIPRIIFFILVMWLAYSMIINLVLGVFNLFPVPPLDGGRIAVGLLPISLARPLARLEPFGILLVFLLLMTGILNHILEPPLRLLFNHVLGGM